jgi:hypothetical protein
MKNSTHEGMVFLGIGNWTRGMGKNIPMTAVRESGNPPIALPPLCPMPQAAGEPRPPTLGMEFPAAFNEF